MNPTWILAANSSRARIFFQERSSEAPLEIDDLVDPAVRLRTSETVTDRLGPTAATSSRHNVGGPLPNKTYEPPQTPVEHEIEVFARNVAGRLLSGYQEGRYKELALVASPQFLGTLRKLLDPRLKAAVTLELNKDYTQSSAREIARHIETHRSAGE